VLTREKVFPLESRRRSRLQRLSWLSWLAWHGQRHRRAALAPLLVYAAAASQRRIRGRLAKGVASIEEEEALVVGEYVGGGGGGGVRVSGDPLLEASLGSNHPSSHLRFCRQCESNKCERDDRYLSEFKRRRRRSSSDSRLENGSGVLAAWAHSWADAQRTGTVECAGGVCRYWQSRALLRRRACLAAIVSAWHAYAVNN